MLPEEPTPRELKQAVEHLQELWSERNRSIETALKLQAGEYTRRLELINEQVESEIARLGARVLLALLAGLVAPIVVGMVTYFLTRKS